MSADCPHRPPCPGCPRFGERGVAPHLWKALDALARTHGLPPLRIAQGRSSGYRLRARLAIRGRVGSPKLGLFETDSHRVVHIPNCSVHHPLINRVAEIVRRALVETKMTSYSDHARLGIARYLQVVIERSSGTAQVVLVANCETPEPVADCLNLIRERMGGELHSLWFNANTGDANTILGPDFQLWCGPESVVEHFGGAAVHYPPGAFGQNNLDVAQLIIAHVRAQIPQDARVVELYAGVGAIGLSLLSGVSQIVMNEMSAQSLRGLELGVAGLSEADRQKVSVIPGDAAAARMMVSGRQVLIVDPPRKGLAPDLIEHLRTEPPERLLYVSCGFESFRGDAARLLYSGDLSLTALSAFDMMPYTEHIETVACFDRVTPNRDTGPDLPP